MSIRSFSLGVFVQASLLIGVLVFSHQGFSEKASESEDEDIKSLEQKLFSGQEPTVGCVVVKKQKSSTTTPSSESSLPTSSSKSSLLPAAQPWHQGYSYVGFGLVAFLEKLLRVLSHGESQQLLELLHPRIRQANQKNVGFPWPIGPKIEASLAGLWAIRSAERSSDDVYCSEGEIYLSGQYGYPVQFFVWVSLSSSDEIHRVMSTVVLLKGKLYVAALHGQRWTHTGKDAWKWVAQGDEELKKKDFMSAFIKYDIAKKLLFGASYYRLAFEDQIKDYTEKHLPYKVWQNKLALLFPEEQLVKATSLFNKEGVGLMLRFALKKEISSVALRAHCMGALNTLMEQSWFAHLGSVRCGYNLPHETNYERDGFLGSIHLLKKKHSPPSSLQGG